MKSKREVAFKKALVSMIRRNLHSPAFAAVIAAGMVLGVFGPVLGQPAHKGTIRSRGDEASASSGPLIPRSEILPLSEVRPGMEGYGLTVFHGTTISRFGVRVVGILRKEYMGRDLILVRMKGGPITERGANIIEGMSGSPIYLKGKLVGAVSMGRQWPKEPMAMVTPIEYMADAFNPRLPTRPQFSAVPWSRQPLTFASAGFQSSLFQNGDAAQQTWDQRFAAAAASLGVSYPSSAPEDRESAGSSLSPRPLMTPLYASGVSPQVVDRLNRMVAPFGLSAAVGLGGGAAPAGTGQAPIVPGSMIGVMLCTGDFQFGGFGTVTYRKGNRILAFGHPLEQLGPVDFPLSACSVSDVFSGYQTSMKLCEQGRIIGALRQDRPWSVMGMLGAAAHTVPMSIRVDDEQTGKARTFHIQCVDHPLWTAPIVDMAAQELVSEVRSYPGDSMADVRVEVDPSGLAPIVRTNTYFDYFSPGGLGLPCLADMDQILDMLQSNPFRAIALRGVKIAIHIHAGRKTSRIERIAVDRSLVAPGDRVHLDVALREWKGETRVVPMDVTIPADAPNGPATLMVTGGMLGPIPSPPSTGGGFTIILGGGGRSAIEPAASLGEMIDRFLKTEKNNDLVARVVVSASPSVNVQGVRLYNLPPALATVLRSPRATGTLPLPDEAKTVVPMSDIILGAQGVAITIQRQEQGGPSFASTAGGMTVSPSAEHTIRPVADTEEPNVPPVSVDGSGDANPFSVSPTQLAAHPGSGADRYDTELIVPPGTTVPGKSEVAAPKHGGSMEVTPGGASPGSILTSSDSSADGVAKRQVWTLHTTAEFAAGHGDGVAVGSLGDLSGALRFHHLRNLDRDDFVWAARSDGKGSVLLGTGNGGRVYRMDAAGQIHLALQTPELDVLSLAAAPDGTAYAGTAPHGYIYRVPAAGSATAGSAAPLFRTGKTYVLALVTDPAGNVYAGTNGGAIYKITPAGVGSIWYQSSEAHICSLCMAPNGDLVAGTSPSGLVFRITPDRHASVIWDSSDASVSGLAALPNGAIVAGTAPKGQIAWFPPGRSDAVQLLKTDSAVHDMAAVGDSIYAASGAALYQIMPTGEVRKIQNEDDQELLCVGAAGDGSLVVGTGNIASVYDVRRPVDGGTYRTAVRDAGSTAHWGHVRWEGESPQGTAVTFESRSGNSSIPDASWSDWEAAPNGPDGAAVNSPPARYIQIRARLVPSPAGASALIRTLALSYVVDNRPPTLTVAAPAAGAALHGKASLQWQAQDPDGDALLYTVQYSVDGGATWKAPDLLDKEKPAGSELTSDAYQWDTSKVKDGSYLLKVTVSDRRSNPTHALEDAVVVGPVLVYNTAPRITLASQAELGPDRSVHLEGLADGSGSTVVGVSYRVDGGAWYAAAPSAGLFDAGKVSFRLETAPLGAGNHKIEVEAVTATGEKINVTVPVKPEAVAAADKQP